MNKFAEKIAESWRARGPQRFLTDRLIYKGWEESGAYTGLSPIGEILLAAGWTEEKIFEIDQENSYGATRIAADLMGISHTHMAFVRMINEINCGANTDTENSVYNALANPERFFGDGTKDLLEFWSKMDSVDLSHISFSEKWVPINNFLNTIRQDYKSNRAVGMIREAIFDTEYVFAQPGDAGATAYNEFELASIQVCLGEVFSEKLPPEMDVAKKFKDAIDAANAAKEAPKTPSKADRERELYDAVSFFMQPTRRPTP